MALCTSLARPGDRVRDSSRGPVVHGRQRKVSDVGRMQPRTGWRQAFTAWCTRHPDQAPTKTGLMFAAVLYEMANPDGSIAWASFDERIVERFRLQPATTRKWLRWYKKNGWLIDVGRANRGRFQRRQLALPPEVHDSRVPDELRAALPMGVTQVTANESGLGVTQVTPITGERGARGDTPKPGLGVTQVTPEQGSTRSVGVRLSPSTPNEGCLDSRRDEQVPQVRAAPDSRRRPGRSANRPLAECGHGVPLIASYCHECEGRPRLPATDKAGVVA